VKLRPSPSTIAAIVCSDSISVSMRMSRAYFYVVACSLAHCRRKASGAAVVRFTGIAPVTIWQLRRPYLASHITPRPTHLLACPGESSSIVAIVVLSHRW
jgi:hypothetical protein